MLRNLTLALLLTSWFSHSQDTLSYDGNELGYSISTDTTTSYHELYPNGNFKRKVTYFHPEGRSFYEDIENAERLEIDFHDDGQVAAEVHWLNNELNGDYLMYDDSSFATHLVFRNDSLVDVKNKNCCFVDQKGKVIGKNEFFELLYSDKFGKWNYYLFEQYPPFSDIHCCDFMIHSSKYFRFTSGKEEKKLAKRLKKNCSQQISKS